VQLYREGIVLLLESPSTTVAQKPRQAVCSGGTLRRLIQIQIKLLIRLLNRHFVRAFGEAVFSAEGTVFGFDFRGDGGFAAHGGEGVVADDAAFAFEDARRVADLHDELAIRVGHGHRGGFFGFVVGLEADLHVGHRFALKAEGPFDLTEAVVPFLAAGEENEGGDEEQDVAVDHDGCGVG
jgi:hypothetical protein